jgi:hypothetical protein
MIIIFLLIIIICLLVAIAIAITTNNCNFYETFTNNNNGQKSQTVVLIGDSMLNNSAFVEQDQSVADLLSNQLAGKGTVYNFAKDGATIADCYPQLDKISSNFNNSNTTIFVSCGGNNILNSRQSVDTDFINNLFDEYSELLKSINVVASNAKAQIHVLNLYTPTSSNYTSYHSAIKQWNQLLDDNASSLGYSVIKTSSLLVTDEDFTYGVEPSHKGGQKLVSKLLDSVIN